MPIYTEFLAPIVGYLDPSATSILLTTITGIVIAVSTTVIIWVRKARRKVSKALHIDENAHKEVEDDVVIRPDAAPSSETDSHTDNRDS